MAPFDECSVLIPAATLEDFPAHADDSDARSLLAGWTVLWHPQLLAQTEQLPTWYRADSPPEPDGPRIVVVPLPSWEQIPSGFQSKCENNKDCLWVAGPNRTAMLESLGLDHFNPILETEHRKISAEDFFAAGYAALQVQIMTRRLRYTSNLDEIHLQKQVVQAAKAFVAGKANETAESLHNVFDCLAEERDHYFSSDPHLIDLTLLTPKTLDDWMQSGGFAFEPEPNDATRLATPMNVLIDADVANEIEKKPDAYADLRKSICDKTLGWMGGSPPSDVCFEAMNFGAAETVLEESFRKAKDVIGSPPSVYGHFAGSTPSDLTPTLVRLGYAGVVPIDFASGTGFGDESKVIQQAGGVEIEALTAKPMDASSDSGFLSLGAAMGELIDAGEIATALMAHWPNQGCDSFHDLRRVASWSLVLGRFWTLEDYFREGEQPYHQGNSKAVSSSAFEALRTRVSGGAENPIRMTLGAAHQSAANETSSRLQGMADLVSAKPDDSKSGGPQEIATRFATASGAQSTDPGDDQTPEAVLVVNPNSAAQRCEVAVKGMVSNQPDHVFASATDSDGVSHAAVDVPAYGFAVIQAGDTPAKKKGILKRFFSIESIAEQQNRLHNEFMELSISEETGGVQGVYSGSTRGNRFSMRLAYVTSNNSAKNKDEEAEEPIMKCDQLTVIESTESVGIIQATGSILGAASQTIADYTINYRLARGSRWLEVSGTIHPQVEFSTEPWQNYIAARSVVASDSAIARVIVRDKIHRASTRRLVAPLGVIMDEADRQTLVASKGLAFHRRIGNRYLDTLLYVKGENKHVEFDVAYGFDVPNPVGHAKSLLSSPIVVPIEKSDKLPDVGWIAHVSPAEASIENLSVFIREDGNLAARVRVIQTRSKSASLSIRFCRDVIFATTLESRTNEQWNQPLPGDEESENAIANPAAVKYKGDAVRLMISGHQVVDLLVVFKTNSG